MRGVKALSLKQRQGGGGERDGWATGRAAGGRAAVARQVAFVVVALGLAAKAEGRGGPTQSSLGVLGRGAAL